MNSEIKTGLILGVIIVVGLGVIGLVFSTLDEQVQSTTTSTDEKRLRKLINQDSKQLQI